MENKITDLIQDALDGPDYKFMINMIVASMVSAESNNTQEKRQTNTIRLKEILTFIANYHGDESRKGYLQHLSLTIKNYLSHQEGGEE